MSSRSRGEALGLRWGDLDLTNRTARIRQTVVDVGGLETDRLGPLFEVVAACGLRRVANVVASSAAPLDPEGGSVNDRSEAPDERSAGRRVSRLPHAAEVRRRAPSPGRVKSQPRPADKYCVCFDCCV